jgi:hypothetical protein
MGALTDLLKSERGFFALVLVIASTVLTSLGQMTVETWKEFNLYIFGIYVVGKSATGAVALFKGGALEPEAPVAAPATPAAEPAKE